MAISIVVPVWNACSHLPDLVDALATQTLPVSQREVLFVDNGSEDGSAEWLAAHLPPSGRLLFSPRSRNAYAARNVGIEQARGRVLAFTDADCRPAPDWLAQGLEAARHHGRVAGRIVVQRSREGGLVEELDASRFLRQRRYSREAFAATANLFVRRSVFDQIGLFDERLVSGGDQEIGARAEAAGLPIAYSHGAVVRHWACRRLSVLVAKAQRVGVGFGQSLRLHSFERVAARGRIADRLTLIPRTWEIAHLQPRERLAVAAGHLILAAATAVGCIEGVGWASRQPTAR
ncbi:MAG: glycosyltransferase [Deltaproteobacteria bacterium]|nr:glycosyltransferase [Deltaproteobacteria bacterium]